MNKNLSQLGQQLLAIWKQLGLNQRISIVLATAVVFIGLCTVALWSSRPDYALLYGKLDDGEASKIVAALDEAKVPYQVRGGSIYVPNDKVYAMRMQMAGKGIPRGEGVGFEIFDKANFGISDFVQRANYTRAVQGELARTISQLDQVESARVMIVMPENRLVMDNARKPTASVFVRVRGNAQLPAASVNSIRFLVANAVEGLQVNNVSVVDNLGNVLSENEENDSVAGLSNNQLTARRNFEQYLTKKAQGMLEQVLGAGQAVVRVSAELNWDTTTRKEEKLDPDGQVAVSTTINDENTETANTGGIGTPGVASNSSETNTNVVASVPVNRSKTTKKVTNNQYEISRMTSEMTMAPGGIKHLSAAVFIAQRFEGKGAERKAVPRTQEEKDKLSNIVRSALGLEEPSDATRKDIVLEEMPFNDQPAMELTQQMDQQEKRQLWFDMAQKAVYPALAIGVLFLFWRLWQKTVKDEIPIAIPATNGNGHRKSAQGVVTVEVLNQLIRENPANMTQAVRSWLSRSKPQE
jgi:flagellar M-ring protein FliF